MKDLALKIQEIRQQILKLSDSVMEKLDGAGLSSEQKAQLKTVDNAISQLVNLGVAVPNDLRQLKLSLSQKEINGEEWNEVREAIAELKFATKQLFNLSQEARTLTSKIISCSRAIDDSQKKYFGVSILMLMNSGQIAAGDRLEYRNQANGTSISARIDSDGMIVVVKGHEETGRFSTLSAAGHFVLGRKDKSSWTRWWLIRTDGTKLRMDNVRDFFLKKINTK